MGESPVLCVSGFHHPALSKNTGSTSDGPIKAYTYNTWMLPHPVRKSKHNFYLTGHFLNDMIRKEVILCLLRE